MVMPKCSYFPNRMSMPRVRLLQDDSKGNRWHTPGMSNVPQHDWYIREWMETCKLKQADLMRLLEWPRAKASDVVTGKQRYNRDLVNEISLIMNCRPYELLMPPADAMALRRLKDDIVTLAASIPERVEKPAKKDISRKFA